MNVTVPTTSAGNAVVAAIDSADMLLVLTTVCELSNVTISLNSSAAMAMIDDMPVIDDETALVDVEEGAEVVRALNCVRLEEILTGEVFEGDLVERGIFGADLVERVVLEVDRVGRRVFCWAATVGELLELLR